jgi:hypothetical protein
MDLEPAHTIIRDFGGQHVIAELTGLHYSTVWHWKRPKNKGGTGGAIPSKYLDLLRGEADRRKLKRALRLLNRGRRA